MMEGVCGRGGDIGTGALLIETERASGASVPFCWSLFMFCVRIDVGNVDGVTDSAGFVKGSDTKLKL